jgi:hypothetical protein
MKILKVIELLLDKDNWFNDHDCYVHKPTGIYFYSGVTIWNSNRKEIYCSFIGSMFILPFFINRIKKNLEEKNPDNLNEIYRNWKANS